MMNRRLLIIVAVVLLGIGVATFFIFSGRPSVNSNNRPVNVSPTNVVSNANTNQSTNSETDGTGLNTEAETTFSGTVFLKGYDTPSESYGILADEGHEIGLESYDSRKEGFRPYIGDRVRVTFSSICRSNHDGCCRTLFPYCGTVKSWEAL